MTKAPLIETKNITRILPLEVPVTLVEDISMTITEGEFISVTGPSGSGKSSLLYLLGLLDRPTKGEILVNGQSTNEMSSEDLCRLRLKNLGFVFQFHFLLAEFTILENVMVPMHRLRKWPVKERIERAKSILNDLGLAEHIHKHPSGLSGGQRQRVAIARAMANEPMVIFADEPTGNLDTKSSRNVHDIFHELVHKHNTSIVMVTHNMDLAKDTHRRIHLVDGRIHEDKLQAA